MHPMTPLGWAHTGFSLVALVIAIRLLWRDGEIRADDRLGRITLGATALTAITALLLHQRAAFGPGHVLAVLALGAIGFGLVVGRGAARGSWRHVLSALAFSFTLLCQLIPGVGEALTRLPPGAPFVSSFDSPVLKLAFLAVLGGFGLLALWQLVRLRRLGG